MGERFNPAIATDARMNRLLATLPAVELQRWLPELEFVDLELGQVLYEIGETPRYAYYPINSVVSLLYVMKNGESAEIAIVGNEGIVGVSIFMSSGATSSRAVVQNAGQGFRLSAQTLKQEFDKGGKMVHVLLRYTQALMTQMTQTAACNRHHSLHQQLCRWMLLSLDRLQGNELVMTQKLIANMLGITSLQVTETAAGLQTDGLIEYQRGTIRVLDRKGVEKCSCECYEVVKEEYDRLLPAAKQVDLFST